MIIMDSYDLLYISVSLDIFILDFSYYVDMRYYIVLSFLQQTNRVYGIKAFIIEIYGELSKHQVD